MPDEDERKKERSKISLRVGDVQIELEGTHENITKLMGRDLFDFTKGLQEPKKPSAPPTEIAPQVTPKTTEFAPKVSEVTPKEKAVPPPSKPSTTAEDSAKPPQVPTIGKTPEKKAPKKIFGKTMVIALGVICIILAAGLIGTIAVYYLPMVSSLEAQIAEKDNTILSLNSQILSLNSQIASLNSQVSSLQDSLNQTNINIAALQSAISSYRSIIYLNESAYLITSQTLTQNANETTTVYNGELNYAGYISVGIESNSTTTYVRVVYSYAQVNYDYNMTVGTNGAAAFPVLPGPIQIMVGNTESTDSVTATVTARYWY